MKGVHVVGSFLRVGKERGVETVNETDYLTCPECGYYPLECDMVDVGIGEIQNGPYGCPRCHYVEQQTNFFD